MPARSQYPYGVPKQIPESGIASMVVPGTVGSYGNPVLLRTCFSWASLPVQLYMRTSMLHVYVEPFGTP